ncbi:caspase family protein [Sediminitomix flava]|nr:caspase family protein [Sediminitomix flava]
MKGRNSTKKIKIKSTYFGHRHRGAEVYIDGDFKGYTPLKVRVPRRNTNHHIEVRKDGFQSSVYDMKRRPSINFLILDALTTGGVGILIDFATGAIYKPDRRKIELPIYLKEPEKKEKAPKEEKVEFVAQNTPQTPTTPPATPSKPSIYQDRERLEGILEAETYKPENKDSKGFGVTPTHVAKDLELDINKSDGKYYALLIGVQDYGDPEINSLTNPINDVTDLNKILIENYEFEGENVQILKNPSRSSIVESFDLLRAKMTAEDNLLIFFAGHGYWDDSSKLGFWLPSDAKRNSTANWLGNSRLKDYISSIPSKHTLLIADACFSGGIFQTRKAFSEDRPDIKRLYDLPSRKAMTSGTLKEVPDESVFVHFLKKRLLENEEKYVSSEELFSSFRRAVMNNSENVPQYGEIKGAGDEGGDFIFIKKDKELMK